MGSWAWRERVGRAVRCQWLLRSKVDVGCLSLGKEWRAGNGWEGPESGC